MTSAQHWLMKTEPDVYSFQDLIAQPKSTDHWDGIRNYQARNFMRDQFELNQTVFIYHSNCKVPGIAGIAQVVRAAYPDHTALDPKSKYFCKKSYEKGESQWLMVDVQATHLFENYISLQEMREWKALQDMAVLKKGQRLSIQPVVESHWKLICDRGSPKAI